MNKKEILFNKAYEKIAFNLSLLFCCLAVLDIRILLISKQILKQENKSFYYT